MDDIIILTVLFSQSVTRKGTMRIVAGQYLGITCLLAVSILGASGAKLLLGQYVGLLGIVPLFLGIRLWFRRGDGSEDDGFQKELTVFNVALITIANGADNISVYIPVFSNFSLFDFAVTVLIFGIMTGAWCWIGDRVGNFPLLKNAINRHRTTIIPVILMILGLVILGKNFYKNG